MYDPGLSYEENYHRGPFPEWCFVRGPGADAGAKPVNGFPELRFLEPPRYFFFDEPIHLPLGVPAGPLLSAKHVRVAWRAGLSVCTYKTVRSQAWPSHPHPNVLGISAAAESLKPSAPLPNVVARSLSKDDVRDQAMRARLSVSNSFGVPSWEPERWQSDVCLAAAEQKSMGAEHPGLTHRVLVLSFQGSRTSVAPGSFAAFVEDTLRAQDLAAQCAPLLELNLSCPNEEGAPLFTDLASSLHLLEALKRRRPQGVRLIVKMGSLPLEQTCLFVRDARGLIDGVSAINTVSARILDPQGQRALGSGSESGGVCGRLILAENLAMMRRLVEARERAGLGARELMLISVGGVFDVASFVAARAEGADHVQAATACMWSLDLAADVARHLGVPFERHLVAARTTSDF